MPQFATITSFYTFQGNTKARATNVNTNFSNFRGHLLPIDPNTISCIGDTYDVGSVEHRFNKGWFNYIEYDRPTTTCSVTQYSNIAVTAGSLVTQINSVSVSEIGSYYDKVNIPLTSGVSEIKIGGATTSSIQQSGPWFSRKITAFTTTALKNQMARSTSSFSATLGAFFITGSTISLEVIGKGSLVESHVNCIFSITSVPVTTSIGFVYNVVYRASTDPTASTSNVFNCEYRSSDTGISTYTFYGSDYLALTAGLYYFAATFSNSFGTNTTYKINTTFKVRETI